MRLFVFGAMMMALFALSSCSETQEIEESVVDDAESLITSGVETWMRLVHDPSNPDATHCDNEEGTCLDPIVVTPKNELLKQSVSYSSMIKHIEEDRVEDFFAQKIWKNVLPMLDENTASNIVEGNIIVERANHRDGGNMIIFKDKKGEVLLAVPFLHEAE